MFGVSVFVIDINCLKGLSFWEKQSTRVLNLKVQKGTLTFLLSLHFLSLPSNHNKIIY